MILGEILEISFFKAKSGTTFNTIYGIRDCNEEILIMGDSEVKHGIISNLLKDSLGLSCYNLGFDGHKIYYQYAMLREILKRYTPQVIIISTSAASEVEVTITPLFPFYEKYSQVKKTILEIAPVEKYKLISNAYAYNSLIIKIIQGLVYSEPKSNGYDPLYTKQHNISLEKISETKNYLVPSSPRSLNYFEKFIRLATSSGCKVVVMNPPKLWHNALHNHEFTLNEIISRNQVIYLDYENDPSFEFHHEIFYDAEHLNHQGAELLTNRIIKDLKDKI